MLPPAIPDTAILIATALMPVVMLPIPRLAAALHIAIAAPLTTRRLLARPLGVYLGLPCMLLGAIGALLTLHPVPFLSNPEHLCLAAGLCVGCCQQLRLIATAPKKSLPSAMAATALAVIVCAMSIFAAIAAPKLARRLLQSAALPFALLFIIVAESTKEEAPIDIESNAKQRLFLPMLPPSLYQGSKRLQQELHQQQQLQQMLRLPKK